jgi:type 2 lantibiotic biosynthesis protein LanM
MTLSERADALRGTADRAAEVPAITGVAQRLFDRWRAQRPFGDEALFKRRLAADGLTEVAFRRILGEPIDQIMGRCPEVPRWIVTLETAYSQPRSNDPLLVPPKLARVPTTGFLELARPLIDEGRLRLRAAAARLCEPIAEPLFDPARVDGYFAPSLAEPLLIMLMRTMVLELNVAKLQGLLAGETPGDRFNDFVDRLRRPEVATAIFLEYPTLARHLAQRVDGWVDAGREVLAHLTADAPALRAMFGPGLDPGGLVAFEGNAGDTHRGGRAVGIATFHSGLKLVYKPKSLAVDVHCQELLAWLNDRGADPAFRILKVLDRGDHGWMEFVERASCASAEEVARFYARQGANLALLYALGATDFHFENVIAVGEHPVLVDLEALFRPVFVEELATSQVMKESVFRTSLLPMRLSAGGDYAGMDISGLGTPGGTLTAQKVADWEDAFQDSMRLVRRRVRMRGAANQPTLGSAPVELDAYLDALRGGFDAMYGLLVAHRDALLAPDGPIARFAGDEIRVIMRDTRAYLQLLSEVFHPDALRDALERDRLLDHLWAQTAKAPYLLEFVEFERAALERGDVPMFTTRTDNLALSSDTGVRIAGCIAMTGLDRTRWRLRQLGARDQARQRWCIDAAFASMADGEQATAAPRVPDALGWQCGPEDRPLRARLLEAAMAVADRLCASAFVEDGLVGWHVLRQVDERYWTVAGAGLDLYGGVPGIAVFLAHLERLTGDDRHAALTRCCVTSLRRAIDATRSTVTSIGGFEGWGGIIYALTNLAWALDDRSLLADAEAIVATLPAMIAGDDALDVVAGAAGCLAGLLCLYRVGRSSRVLAAAIACGERLLERAQPMVHGLGWRTPIAPDQALCGLSHGAAGIGGALLELFAVTGDPRFRTAAEGAFAYERSQWSPVDAAWPDLRRSSGDSAPATAPPGTTCAWCHGAPGIGLVRIRALEHLDDPSLRDDVAQAVAATLRGGFGHNHSLCHGDLGNLELLVQASAALADAAARAAVERVQLEILGDIARLGFVCATPRALETPGLMLGLAGIGYGLLRLADPARVPSVLLLDGPKGPW